MDVPILGPKAEPTERDRLAVLRGLARDEPSAVGKLIVPPGYSRRPKKKGSGGKKRRKRK